MATSALEFAPEGRAGGAGLALKLWEDGATWTHLHVAQPRPQPRCHGRDRAWQGHGTAEPAAGSAQGWGRAALGAREI